MDKGGMIMSEKEILKNLIDNAKQPNVTEWAFNVETFLHDTKEGGAEVFRYIRGIKDVGDDLNYSANLIAWLKQLYKRKYDKVEIPAITKRNQIFVAMMFSPDMKDIYENGYKSIIQSLNYSCMRIDEKDYTGLIINEITSEISDSVALIADLTGNRGGVYYEAGIARGLQVCNHPIKLILTCKQEFFDKEKVHFDVSGDNILLYTNVNDLSKKLEKRLKTVLGKTNK